MERPAPSCIPLGETYDVIQQSSRTRHGAQTIHRWSVGVLENGGTSGPSYAQPLGQVRCARSYSYNNREEPLDFQTAVSFRTPPPRHYLLLASLDGFLFFPDVWAALWLCYTTTTTKTCSTRLTTPSRIASSTSSCRRCCMAFSLWWWAWP